MQETAKSSRSRKRARRSRAEWLEEVRRWRESGQSAAEYSAERGLHSGTLGGWASKVRDVVAARPGGNRPRKSVFVPLRVAQAPTTSAKAGLGEIEVVLLNGRRVRFSGNFEGEVVARLLAIVEGGAAC
jgi:hypothetical protein